MKIYLFFKKVKKRMNDKALLNLQAEINEEVERRGINDSQAKSIIGSK